MKKIFLLILLLSVTGCVKKEFTFEDVKDYVFVKDNKEDIEKIVLKTNTLMGEKCYLLNTEEAYSLLDNIIISEETTEHVTDSDFYVMVHFNENIKRKYYFEKQRLYEEKIVKTFWFEGSNLVHSGKNYKLEKGPIFFTNKDDVPEDIDKENNVVIVAEREVQCEVLKQVVREY